jgi:hypothetical protein
VVARGAAEADFVSEIRVNSATGAARISQILKLKGSVVGEVALIVTVVPALAAGLLLL